ncbi:hypothetical protein HPB48_026153 [Haemaphysalis longicornis]|uniref:Integrase catalytic domain-containing protein n=1 Tax=Haemaphysalis longicornis TaxID=44386 RepID=A0A9J6HBE4_HAELO|nr:hypothetical protein HPB48_026153 [Haemaphysalis longicornis]
MKEHIFLVVKNAFIEWLEVRRKNSLTSTALISVLRSRFATFGIQRKVGLDSANAFVSSEIQEFSQIDGIQSVR